MPTDFVLFSFIITFDSIVFYLLVVEDLGIKSRIKEPSCQVSKTVKSRKLMQKRNSRLQHIKGVWNRNSGYRNRPISFVPNAVPNRRTLIILLLFVPCDSEYYYEYYYINN